MSILKFFKDNEAQSISILSQHLPSGPAWEAKARPESNFYKILKGMVQEFSRVEAQIQGVADEHDINQTVELLTEWETSVGIPDECFSIDISVAQRRDNVILKLGALNGVVSDQDFIDIAAVLGFVVTIVPGSTIALFPLLFPLPLFLDANDARFTMRVEVDNAPPPGVFPLAFPIPFTGDNANILECVFNLLKPSVTKIQFVYLG